MNAFQINIFLTYSVLNVSEVRLKVSMTMSPSQRPRGVLGFWASLMTALGNTENMPVSATVLLCDVSWFHGFEDLFLETSPSNFLA